MVKAAEHRSKGRIPILSYVHQNGATITRCAQPLTGLKDKKSKADIKFGAALVNATPHSEGLLLFYCCFIILLFYFFIIYDLLLVITF